MTKPGVSITTFGCRVNQYESAMMAQLLGSQRTKATAQTDVHVLNACTVTRLAERKARQAARRLRRDYPGSRIVVIGCLADAVEQGLTQFDDADLLAGNAWKSHIVDVIRRAHLGERGLLPPIEPCPLGEERSRGTQGRARAYLKVQDGCSRACTYCRPTQLRGLPRSKPIDSAVSEACGLIRDGFPEIVLTGIDLAQYAPSDATLADAVRRILAIKGLARLRIASLNPAGLVSPLITAFASDDRACPHFHIPLQSGDDQVLHRMARGYTVSKYLEAIDTVRREIPHATFGTDVIVGFPGESDSAFANTCQVVQDVGFINLHVFRFSARPGTAATGLPNPIPEDVKRRRAEQLDQQWRRTRRRQLDNRIGSTHHVLVEERRGEQWRGYTSDYLYVHFASDQEIPVGSIRSVRIIAVVEDHLEGTIDD